MSNPLHQPQQPADLFMEMLQHGIIGVIFLHRVLLDSIQALTSSGQN